MPRNIQTARIPLAIPSQAKPERIRQIMGSGEKHGPDPIPERLLPPQPEPA